MWYDKGWGLFMIIPCINLIWSALTTASIPKTQGLEDRILNSLLRPTVYTKNDPPRLDSATEVQIGVYVVSFNYLSEQTMDFSLTVYFRQNWTDPRLIYTKPDRVTEEIKLDEFYWRKIWLPDTFFRNEKKADFHRVTIPNRYFTLNMTDGRVWYATKITMTLSCLMSLHKYPMDTQKCPLLFESFGYKRQTMYLTWLAKNLEISDEYLPQFIYSGHEESDCSRSNSAGHFGSCLQLTFIFKRDVGFFVIQVFVPSMLIVSLSWVSFWINPDSAPARVSLGLLTVLTVTSYSMAINQNLPRVSYVKAIDVWMSACLLFVFCALCEYAFVNVAARMKTVHRPSVAAAVRSMELQAGRIEEDATMALPPRSPGRPMLVPARGKPGMIVDKDGKARARKIDMVSRRSFPLIFVVFNIVYWLTYVFIEIPDDK